MGVAAVGGRWGGRPGVLACVREMEVEEVNLEKKKEMKEKNNFVGPCKRCYFTVSFIVTILRRDFQNRKTRVWCHVLAFYGSAVYGLG
jgi:hypothetical protein